jgi:hypothetical protein
MIENQVRVEFTTEYILVHGSGFMVHGYQLRTEEPLTIHHEPLTSIREP